MALTVERAKRLNSILSKRMGRPLSDIELESAYKSLIEIVVVLVDLVPDEKITTNNNRAHVDNLHLAIRA